jgi:hypothetical protein
MLLFLKAITSDLICYFPFRVSEVLKKYPPKCFTIQNCIQVPPEMSSGSPASSSSSSQSSGTPPPPQVLGGKASKSSKEKAKAKAKDSLQDGRGRNEGTDPTWNYAPPAGAVLVTDDVDAGEFDWDTINDNDDLELWLIRVPDSVGLILKIYRKSVSHFCEFR